MILFLCDLCYVNVQREECTTVIVGGINILTIHSCKQCKTDFIEAIKNTFFNMKCAIPKKTIEPTL